MSSPTAAPATSPPAMQTPPRAQRSWAGRRRRPWPTCAGIPGTGRKIGRNNNISLDSPSFSNELENNPNKINNSENLGKSFIEFANEQPKDIRQALKKMLQNKEIETKCK